MTLYLYILSWVMIAMGIAGSVNKKVKSFPDWFAMAFFASIAYVIWWYVR